MSSQTAQETMPTISPGDEVIVMSQQTPSLQRAPVAGVSIALTVFPNSSGNVQSDSSSLKPDQAPSHPVPSMSWVARAHRFKYWLTKPRVNLSIGILSLIPAVIFGDGAWVQSNLNQKSFDISLWSACLQNANNPVGPNWSLYADGQNN